MAIGWGADDARVIRALGEELEIPRMLDVRPNGFPKTRPSAERLAACADAEPAAAPAPIAIAIEAPVAEPPREPAPPAPKAAPVDPSAPQQGDLFARLSARSTLQ